MYSARHLLGLLGNECGCIDNEAVLDIGLEDALISIVDLVCCDELNLCSDAVLSAEVEHLLSLLDTTDEGTSEAASTEDQREGSNGGGVLGSADKHHGAITLQEVDVLVKADVSRDSVDNKVEGTLERLESLGIRGSECLGGTEALHVIDLGEGLGKRNDVGTHLGSDLDGHVTETTATDNSDALARATLPVSQRRVNGDTSAQERSSLSERKAVRNAKDEVLVDHDDIGVTTISHTRLASVLEVSRVKRIVGPLTSLFAVLLKILLALRAGSA